MEILHLAGHFSSSWSLVRQPGSDNCGLLDHEHGPEEHIFVTPHVPYFMYQEKSPGWLNHNLCGSQTRIWNQGFDQFLELWFNKVRFLSHSSWGRKERNVWDRSLLLNNCAHHVWSTCTGPLSNTQVLRKLENGTLFGHAWSLRQEVHVCKIAANT